MSRSVAETVHQVFDAEYQEPDANADPQQELIAAARRATAQEIVDY